MDKDLQAEEKELTDDINNLNKKVGTCYYLELFTISDTYHFCRISTWKSSSTMPKPSYVIS